MSNNTYMMRFQDHRDDSIGREAEITQPLAIAQGSGPLCGRIRTSRSRICERGHIFEPSKKS